MMSGVSGLGTGFPFALALSPTRSLLARQAVRRRWFGRIGRVLLPTGQLPLQIGDLLFGIGDLLFAFSNLFFAFGHFTAKLFVLAQQPLIFPM